MPNTNGNLINALLAFGRKELTPEQATTLETLIESNTDPRGAVAKDTGDVDPENVERAVDLLRSNGIAEGDIAKFRDICGVAKPTHAQDSARREAIRVGNERSFAARFPDASKITVNPY
jgi:hypothetical protein